MDLTPSPAFSPPPDDRPSPGAGSTSGLGDLAARLSTVESSIEDLGRRVDAMAASIEPSVRQAVGAEMATVSGEMRHTVSELGRLIVRDLGKLTQVLAKHREAIVAELRPGRAAASTTAPAFVPSEPPTATDTDTPAEAQATGSDAGRPLDVADGTPAAAEATGDEPGRRGRRSLRGRRDTSLR